MWGCIPTIERRATIVRTITAIVVVGGLARLYGWIVAGDPGTIRWALGMELVVTPLLCLWQARVARLNRREHEGRLERPRLPRRRRRDKTLRSDPRHAAGRAESLGILGVLGG